MIPSLLFLMIRRYRQKNPEKFGLIIKRLVYTGKCALLLLISLLVLSTAWSQKRTLRYLIKRNGSDVGELRFMEERNQGKTIYRLESLVKTRFIISFNATGTEEAVFNNGILVSSSILRKLNGNEKANRSIKASGNSYLSMGKGSEQKLDRYPIKQNMLCLYTKEPDYITEVYSDNFQRFVPIQKLNPRHYKITFPDGNSSEYFYNNGICTRIKINHTLYKAEVLLTM